MRYKTRQLEKGWTVWDSQTNAPAVVDGRWFTALGPTEAFNLAQWLNRSARPATAHPPPEEDLGGGDICSLQEEPSTDDDRPLE